MKRQTRSRSPRKIAAQSRGAAHQKKAPQPFILGINGSPHTDGVVADLLKRVLKGAEKEGAETRLVNLYDLTIIPERGVYSENPKRAVAKKMPKDGITALYPDILRADGLVLATPVYWASMSAVMKSFIEHLTPLENDGFRLEGKIAAFISASKENEGGLELASLEMVSAFSQMGMLIPPNAVMWAPTKYVTTKGDRSGWAKRDAPIVGKNMVKLTKLLRDHPMRWS